MKTRDYFFDNMKTFLIFFVVLGHMIEPFVDKSFIFVIYTLIYSFHMPLFVFISGYFAKPNFKGIGKLIKIFVIYQVIYAIFSLILINISPYLSTYLSGNVSSEGMLNVLKTVFTPYWILWYLVSLIIWRILLALLYRFDKYVVFTIAIILGLIVSVTPIDTRILSIGRTFTFFPFFLVGFYISRKHLIDILTFFKHKVVFIFSVLFCILLFYAVFTLGFLNKEAFYYADSSSSEIYYSIITRLSFLFINIFMCIFALILIPHSENRFSYLGKYTLGIFVNHIFVFLVIYSIGFYALIENLNQLVIVIILTLLSMLICYVLGRDIKWIK